MGPTTSGDNLVITSVMSGLSAATSCVVPTASSERRISMAPVSISVAVLLVPTGTRPWSDAICAGTPSFGMAPSGMAPSGMAPSGVDPSGVDPFGIVMSRAVSNSLTRCAASPATAVFGFLSRAPAISSSGSPEAGLLPRPRAAINIAAAGRGVRAAGSDLA